MPSAPNGTPQEAAQASQAGSKLNSGKTVLTDALWPRVDPRCLGEATEPGVTAAENRQVIETVL